jgi:catalase
MMGPGEAIDIVNGVFGRHAGFRALHAKGIVCRGSFTPDPAAASLTRAAHMHGGTLPATVRFSNAAGDPTRPDWLPGPRGLAVKLYLPDGGRTDIVAVSSPRLPVRTPEDFIGLIKAQGPGPRPGFRLPLFLLRHPGVVFALPSLMPTVMLRTSYAGITYFGIHAFSWVDGEDRATFVRYTLEPDVPAPRLSPKQAKRGGPDYLQNELRERLATGPAGYTLTLTIAEPGDPTDDPSAVWPAGRRQVTAGRLVVDALDTERETGDDVLVFDPTRVIDGIELSDDPVLRFRGPAYTESVARRMRSG